MNSSAYKNKIPCRKKTNLGQIWSLNSLDDRGVVQDGLCRLFGDVPGPLEIRNDLRGLVSAQERRDVENLQKLISH